MIPTNKEIQHFRCNSVISQSIGETVATRKEKAYARVMAITETIRWRGFDKGVYERPLTSSFAWDITPQGWDFWSKYVPKYR